jgi:hypothetical protein
VSNLEIAHWWHRCNRFSRIILQLATKRNVCLNGMACKKKDGAGMRCVVINHYTDLLGVLRGQLLVLSVSFPRETRTLCSCCVAHDNVKTSRGRRDKPERQSDCASLLTYKEVLMRWISVIKTMFAGTAVGHRTCLHFLQIHCLCILSPVFLLVREVVKYLYINVFLVNRLTV